MAVKHVKIYLKGVTLPHEFKLGPGPCGLEVESLGTQNDGPNGLFVVRQNVRTDDGVQSGFFSYPLENVARTVVYHYDPDNQACALPPGGLWAGGAAA